MLYLVTFGMSAYHGSELAVGWQWYRRLRAKGTVTVLAHATFDSPEYVPSLARSDIVYLGQAPAERDQVNRHHVRYAYSFWGSVLRHLRRHAAPADRVHIVSPAAAWFLPLVVGVPLPRERFSYGPLGVSLVDARLCSSRRLRARMRLRNDLTRALSLVWRYGSPLLPRTLSFRFDADWFVDRIGPAYIDAGSMPEVESPAEPEASAKDPPATDARGARDVMMMWEERAVKNVWANLALGSQFARERCRRLFVVGAGADAAKRIWRSGLAMGVELELLPRLAPAAFRRFLREVQPTVVCLSVNEGVPSLLMEALVEGSEVATYGVGGIVWLERFAASLEIREFNGRDVRVIRWGAKSHDHYRTFVGERLDHLATRLAAEPLPTPAERRP